MIIHSDNTKQKFPVMTFGLIAINTIMWGYIFFLKSSHYYFYSKFAFIPESFTFNLLHFPFSYETYIPLFSCVFIHGTWLHIILNMIYLGIFGPSIEKKMGWFNFLFFYLLCGLGANLVQYAFFIHAQYAMIGASGSISGILAGYLFLYPIRQFFDFTKHPFFLNFFQFSSLLYIFFWFFFQLVSAFFSFINQGNAGSWVSHIGGFLTGMILYSYFVSKRKDKKIHYI